MKKILVPTDFTKLSENALDFAIDLAKATGAQIDLVHFVDIPVEEVTFVTGDSHGEGTTKETLYDIQLMRANKKKLEAQAASRAENNVKIHMELAGSGFLHGSQKYIEKYGGDLVIVGTTGEESVQEFFTGNHTEQLIQHLGVPVISMKEKVDYEHLTDIVLGIDLVGEKYPSSAMPLIKSVAESFGAKIHLVNIVKPGEMGLKSLQVGLENFAKDAGFTNYAVSVVEYKNDLDGLLYFAEKIGSGLIAIVSDARPGVFRFFQDSFATEITKLSDLPVMVLNKRNLR